MERYYVIAKSNFKFQLFPHVLIALLFCFCSPMIMGVENLGPLQTAKIIELFVSLFGIILLIPLFMADDDKSIRELCRSKKESALTVHLIRLFEEMILLFLMIAIYLFFLKQNHCDFPFAAFYYGAIANTVFLGGVGVLVYSVLDIMPVAYMIPMLYYIACYGGVEKYLGKFYLFTMMRGYTGDKIYLLAAGIVMLTVGILYRDCIRSVVKQ